jgi:hypothetical protein
MEGLLRTVEASQDPIVMGCWWFWLAFWVKIGRISPSGVPLAAPTSWWWLELRVDG